MCTCNKLGCMSCGFEHYSRGLSGIAAGQGLGEAVTAQQMAAPFNIDTAVARARSLAEQLNRTLAELEKHGVDTIGVIGSPRFDGAATPTRVSLCLNFKAKP